MDNRVSRFMFSRNYSLTKILIIIRNGIFRETMSEDLNFLCLHESFIVIMTMNNVMVMFSLKRVVFRWIFPSTFDRLLFTIRRKYMVI